VLLFFCLFLAIPASSQTGRGKARIFGVVLDGAGDPVPSAKIELQNLGAHPTKFETMTDAKGRWSFLGPGTGSWQVTASREGYHSATIDCHVSQLEKHPRIVLVLEKIEPGGLNEESLKILDKANEFFSVGKYREALLSYLQYLEFQPEAHLVSINIGICYREMGELDKAIEQFNKVVEKTSLDPSYKVITAWAFTGIGECCWRKKDLENTLYFFKKAIELSPENERLAYNLGEICFSKRAVDEAIEYYTRASQLKPDWSDPYYKLGLAYLKKADYEKAKEHFKKYLTLDQYSDRAAEVERFLDDLEKIKK
jgi:tetratricopeptide (TPR) repeat protein